MKEFAATFLTLTILSYVQMQTDWSKYISGKQLMATNMQINSTKGLKTYSSKLIFLDLKNNLLQLVDEIEYLTKLTELSLSENQIQIFNHASECKKLMILS